MRPSLLMPESKDMTLMPLLIAFLVMGMRASRSLAEMAMPCDLLGDEGIDDLDLALGGGRGRALVDDLGVAELLGRLLPAVAHRVEEAVAQALDDDGDLGDLGRRGGAGAKATAATSDGGTSREAILVFFLIEFLLRIDCDTTS